MKITLTPRDKKLLVGLAVFLLIVGVGFGILYPMIKAEKRLSEALKTEKAIMDENQRKINELDIMKLDREQAGARLSSLSEDYFPVMTSMEVENMMTRLALDKGVIMKDIDINMPETGEYANLPDYSKMLRGDSTGEGEQEDSEEESAFYGLYRVEVKMSMTGSRSKLQAVLDACQEKEPKMQVDEILWQRSSAEKDGEYTLAIKVSVYMAENLEQYMDGERGQQQ